MPLRKLHSTPVSTFHCPSRRPAATYPHGITHSCYNCTFLKGSRGNTGITEAVKADYAGNAGDGVKNAADENPNPDFWWPKNYDQADEADAKWDDTETPTLPNGRPNPFYCTGVIYYRSEVKFQQIVDGASSTYFTGEKYINPGCIRFFRLRLWRKPNGIQRFRMGQHPTDAAQRDHTIGNRNLCAPTGSGGHSQCACIWQRPSRWIACGDVRRLRENGSVRH